MKRGLRHSIPATAAIAVLFLNCSGRTEVQTATAVKKMILVPILAEGLLEPPPGGEIRSSEAGVVGQILAKEGQQVVKGSALLVLDNPDLVQRLLSARTESAQVVEERQKTSIELAGAQREAEHLRAVVDADQRLVTAGAMTAEQQRADDLAYRQAVEKVRAAEGHIASMVKRSEIVASSARELEQRVAQLTVRAPVAGVVYNLPRVRGENIVPGQVLGSVTEPARVRVRIRVDAPDLPRIKIGQAIIVRFDGLPARRWNGQVLLVPPGLRDVAGREVAEVIGDISDDASALPPNASVNVEIIVGQKAAALVIPRGALRRDGDRRFIYVDRNHTARRVNVTIGLIGPNEAEILSGLNEGDEVILPGAATIRDGTSIDGGHAQP
ncbi:MAG TPA: efflux RND transporter periplasmic adaptor subunit [Thermoanaerobaculia bacterium]|nr:efflux RND transporter periplasmic adaptor subunit [Thermoanaerobaculia bacterium]